MSMTLPDSNAPLLILATNKGALYQGDCLQLFRQIKSNSIDCIFADPPFNLGKTYDPKISDRLPEIEYLEWTQRWLDESVRTLKPGGSLFIYHMPKWLLAIGSYLSKMDCIEFRNWIAIKMKNGFPIKNRLHPAHYGLVYYTKSGKQHKFHTVRTASPTCRHCRELIRDYGGYRKKYPTNEQNIPLIRLADYWDDVSPNIHKKSRPHMVNELPSIIPERAILMSTNRGDVILDPFAGGAASLCVSQLNNRYWLGCELGDTSNACDRVLSETNATRRSEPPTKLKKLLGNKPLVFKKSNPDLFDSVKGAENSESGDQRSLVALGPSG